MDTTKRKLTNVRPKAVAIAVRQNGILYDMNTMSKIILLFALILTMLISESVKASTTLANITETTGIDDGTDTLLPGSDWTRVVSPDVDTTCDELGPNLSFYKSTLVPVTSYIDRDKECDADPNDHIGFETETYITWVDDGYEQKSTFGTEEITCPVYGACEMDRVVNTETKYFAQLPLLNGENGTSNGAGKIYVGKLENASIQSVPGTGGVGGSNDLTSVPPITRYCVQIQDAANNPTTATSKRPYATVHAYTWLPLDIGAGGSNGVDAPTGKKVEIYEGLSPTTLNRLKEAYLK